MTTAIDDVIEVSALAGSNATTHIRRPRLAIEIDRGWPIPGGLLVFRLILARYGDKRYAWNPLSLPEIREAEEFFLQCISQGLVPYHVGPDGNSAEVMDEFAPGAGEALFKKIASEGGQVVMQPKKPIAAG